MHPRTSMDAPEVVPQSAPEAVIQAPEVVPKDTARYDHPGHLSQPDSHYGPPPQYSSGKELYRGDEPTYKKSRRKWWIIGVVLVVVVAAAVGGGVGGALGNKKSNNARKSTTTTSVAPGASGPPSLDPAGMPTSSPTFRAPIPSSSVTAQSACKGAMCKRMLSTTSTTSGASIFGVGVANGLYYKTAKDKEWDGNGDWNYLGGNFAYPPAAVSWGEDRIDVFGVGTDGALYERHYEGGTWSQNWTSLGGTFTSPPAVTAWGLKRLDVFIIGLDTAMYHKAYGAGTNPGWDKNWYSLGGSFDSPPTVTSWGPNRLDMVCLGKDNLIYQNYWEGQWGTWLRLGEVTNKFKSPPTMTSWGSKRLDIFGVGVDDSMYHIAFDNRWSEWEDLGGKWESQPNVDASDPNRLELVAIGAQDDTIYHKRLVGNSWEEWESLEQKCSSAPAVLSIESKGATVFCIGTDDAMKTRTFTGGTWSDWTQLKGIFALGL